MGAQTVIMSSLVRGRKLGIIAINYSFKENCRPYDLKMALLRTESAKKKIFYMNGYGFEVCW
jgi:hypothetical protein